VESSLAPRRQTHEGHRGTCAGPKMPPWAVPFRQRPDSQDRRALTLKCRDAQVDHGVYLLHVCRFPGGKSTGPRTQAGLERCAAAKILHGQDTRGHAPGAPACFDAVEGTRNVRQKDWADPLKVDRHAWLLVASAGPRPGNSRLGSEAERSGARRRPVRHPFKSAHGREVRYASPLRYFEVQCSIFRPMTSCS